MTTLIGIVGSARARSYNKALLKACARLAPAGVRIEDAALGEIPLYDGDAETDTGMPPAVTALQERIVAADGLLLVTPEYNASFTPLLKNTLDWLSRPAGAAGRVFGGKPLALTGATPGGGGTISAQTALLPTLRALGVNLWNGPRLFVSGAGKAFDEDLNLVDAALESRVREFVSGFVGFVELVKRP